MGMMMVGMAASLTACGDRQESAGSSAAPSVSVNTSAAASSGVSTELPKGTPTPKVEWEQVGRPQRILGTITAIEAKGDQIHTISLKATKNVYPVNNPVLYDYTGQTVVLLVDEPASEAGKLQEELKPGSSFLVTFAQVSVPPQGDMALGARFSHHDFYYEHDGRYTDINGEPFDLKASDEAGKPTTVPVPETDNKTLYELNAKMMTQELKNIPYYQQGKTDPLPESFFQSEQEGHQPWRSNPVMSALINCSNLISQEEVGALQKNAQINEKKIILDDEHIITETARKDGEVQVSMLKPGGVTYDITMYAPKGTDILYVKRIVEHTPKGSVSSAH